MTLSEVVEYSKVTEQDASFGDRVYDAFWTGWYGFVDNAEDFAVWFVRNVTTIGTLVIIGLIVLLIVLINNKKHAPKPPTAPTAQAKKEKKQKTAKKAKKAAQVTAQEVESAPASAVPTEQPKETDENNQ
jgi:hypothetical protein